MPIRKLVRKYSIQTTSVRNNELDQIDSMISAMIQREEKDGKELQDHYRMLREQILYRIAEGKYSPSLESRRLMLNIQLKGALLGKFTCKMENMDEADDSAAFKKEDNGGEKETGNKNQSETAVRAIKYIDENDTRYDLSLDLVAQELQITAAYLCRLIKQQTGMNYKEYLTRMRMEEAKKLLRNKNANIADVCEKAGYTNVSHFIKTFQKYEGTTPAKYRDIQ